MDHHHHSKPWPLVAILVIAVIGIFTVVLPIVHMTTGYAHQLNEKMHQGYPQPTSSQNP